MTRRASLPALIVLLFGASHGSSQELAETQAPVKVRFELAAKGPTQDLRGTLALKPVAVGGEPISLAVDGKALLEAVLPNGSRWALAVQIPGYWTPTRVVVAEPKPEDGLEKVILWPTATLRGTVKWTGEAEEAVALSVRIEGTPFSQAALPPGEIACTVGLDRRFSCEVPAGALDLSFRAKSYIPIYRWGVSLKPAEVKAVGEIALREGSSLSGWVTVEGGTVAPSCVAKLVTATAGPAVAPSMSHRVAKAGNRAPVNKEGFFQLTGIAPGSYVLVVEQPGFAPAELSGVDVWPSSETALPNPILLKRPLELEVLIDPPLDWLQRPWQVEVLRGHDFSVQLDRKPVFDGPASEDGLVHVKGQRPGRYSILVSDSLGNRFVADPMVQVLGREDARREIHIDLVSVGGQVTHGKEPVAATLWFGGRFGGHRVEMTSDVDGEFHGVLPQGGKWTVEVSAAEPRLETQVSVDVKPDREGEAVVDVRLPDTLVFGRVLNEQGEAIPGADVFFKSATAAIGAETGAEGRFESHALPEGLLQVSARAFTSQGKLLSEDTVLNLSEAHPVGPIDLVVRATKSLVGRVESLRGPVVGGTVLVFSQIPRIGAGAVARTDLDGGFSVAVPGQALHLTAIVSPPGRALKAFSLPAMKDPVVLHVPEEGGGLELELPLEADLLRQEEVVLIVHQDGHYLPGSDLLRWAMGHGVSMYEGRIVRVPQLAPGRYEACLTPATVPGADPNAWKSKKTVCAAGNLVAGNTLQLKLDRAE